MEALFSAIEASAPLTPRGSAQQTALPSTESERRDLTSPGNAHFDSANEPLISGGKGSFRCHLCDRAYERGDHLNRHLKTHENARPHKCSQCPKRFNRADLLNRHEAGHKKAPGRRGDGSDRVLTACLACVVSKCKCQDQKPCVRCQKKQIPCEVGPSQGHSGQRPTRSGHMSHEGRSIDSTPGLMQDDENFGVDGQISGAPELSTWSPRNFPVGTTYGNDTNLPMALDHETLQQYPFLPGEIQFNQGLGFIPRDSYFGQELDFGLWDMEHTDFDIQLNVGVEEVLVNKQSSTEPAVVHGTASTNASKRYAAFERSPWVFNPTQKDHMLNDETNLNVDEGSISLALTPNTPVASLDQFASCCIDSSIRDQILRLLFDLRVAHNPIRSFPPLSLLNIIIGVYFVQSRSSFSHLIHSASFNPKTVLPELLLAIISAGATSISAPPIWKLGLVLQEIMRLSVVELWERNNANIRKLQTIQAWMIGLDVGLWSGVKRKMEIAESFAQPIMMMLRRMGAFSAVKGSPALLPSMDDPEPVLQAKWEKFVERESFKRLVLHLFIHDAQASVGFQKPPQMSFTEIQLDLPVSRDLWLAESASQWRDIYLDKQLTSVPTFMEAIHGPEALQQVANQVDVRLCAMVILEGYWGQIWRLMEARKFYSSTRAAYRLSLMTEHDELYRDLLTAATKLSSLCRNEPVIILIGEFFLMVSHISPEDLQRFAGKYGPEESRKASDDFRTWFQSSDSRMAIWHAGQVLRAARDLLPTQLRDFYAVAVYYASLTLWVYGIVLRSRQGIRGPGAMLSTPTSIDSSDNNTQIILNEEETVYLSTFRVGNEGIPGLAILDEDQCVEFVPITCTNRVLDYGRWLYRNNFPQIDEPLPPLLENLGNLMRDLGSSPGSRVSRMASEVPE